MAAPVVKWMGKLSETGIDFFLCPVHFPQTEAKALILGPTDIYVKIGSAVTLTCIITQGPHDLGTIYWYRGK